MKQIPFHQDAVSNIVAYMITLSIVFLLMVGTIFLTTSILDAQSYDAIELEAETIANQISDSLLEIVQMKQLYPNANYTVRLDIPPKLGGYSSYHGAIGRLYYIEISNNSVWVNVTNGLSIKNTIYNIDEHGIHLQKKRISSDASQIQLNLPETKIYSSYDFSCGNITSHSPVENGYYFVSENSSNAARDWWSKEKPFRIPICINNTPPVGCTLCARDQINITLPVVLTPSNFKYQYANVSFDSTSEKYATTNLYFVLKKNGLFSELPYCVDYWNPNGTSVIRLLLPELLQNQDEIIYLYYGDPNTKTHRLSENSLFFEDFNKSFDDSRWTLSDATMKDTIDDIGIMIKSGQYMITNTDKIEVNTIEDPDEKTNYILETKMKLNTRLYQGYNSTINASQILLSQNTNTWDHSYVPTLLCDVTPAKSLFDYLLQLYKYDFTLGIKQKIQNQTLPIIDNWIRMRSYIYINNNTGSKNTMISTFLYDFETFAPIIYNVEMSDTSTDKVITGSPWTQGYFGIGCNITQAPLVLTDNITVDWLRIIKTPDGYHPTVILGPLESNRYEWDNPLAITSIHRLTQNPYSASPENRDYNKIDVSTIFRIKNLPEGTYYVRITKGDTTQTHPGKNVQVSFDSTKTIHLPETAIGEFISIEFKIQSDTKNNLEFDFPAGAIINSLQIFNKGGTIYIES